MAIVGSSGAFYWEWADHAQRTAPPISLFSVSLLASSTEAEVFLLSMRTPTVFYFFMDTLGYIGYSGLRTWCQKQFPKKSLGV